MLAPVIFSNSLLDKINSSTSGCCTLMDIIIAARRPSCPTTLDISLNSGIKLTAPDDVFALLLTLESAGLSGEMFIPHPPRYLNIEANCAPTLNIDSIESSSNATKKQFDVEPNFGLPKFAITDPPGTIMLKSSRNARKYSESLCRLNLFCPCGDNFFLSKSPIPGKFASALANSFAILRCISFGVYSIGNPSSSLRAYLSNQTWAANVSPLK